MCPSISTSSCPPAAAAQAFLGDATWGQLFPTQFSTAQPFPCFNVKDLHTVDDGVWERLLPLLRRPGRCAAVCDAASRPGKVML